MGNIKIGCFGWLVIIFLLALVVQWAQSPWFWIVLVILVAALIGFSKMNKKDRQSALTQELLTLAAILETQANNLDADRSLDEEGLSLRKDERALIRLEGVSLLEWKSNGSSYQGGNVGVSFRVARGVSIGGGRSAGQLTKNPATKQITDDGTATFTNQRVTFVGAQKSMQWDFDKMVGADPGPNGLTVQISVSNRSSNSGLAVTNHSQITPGIALDIATTYAEDGKAAAVAKCREYASQLRASVQAADKPALN